VTERIVREWIVRGMTVREGGQEGRADRKVIG
jgi:hypothetical protein